MVAFSAGETGVGGLPNIRRGRGSWQTEIQKEKQKCGEHYASGSSRGSSAEDPEKEQESEEKPKRAEEKEQEIELPPVSKLLELEQQCRAATTTAHGNEARIRPQIPLRPCEQRPKPCRGGGVHKEVLGRRKQGQRDFQLLSDSSQARVEGQGSRRARVRNSFALSRLLSSGDLAALGDGLAGRFIAVESATLAGSWADAQHLEVIANRTPGVAQYNILLKVQKHARTVELATGRGSWSRAQGAGWEVGLLTNPQETQSLRREEKEKEGRQRPKERKGRRAHGAKSQAPQREPPKLQSEVGPILAGCGVGSPWKQQSL